MGQMVEALSFPNEVTSASLALFSVAQAAARVATGALSESALNWNTRNCCIDNGVPRPTFLVAASVVGFVAHFSLAIATEEVPFVFGATLSGAAFGMVWPLMVLIVGEVFGTAHVGANYMFFDGFTSAAGTLLLSKVSVCCVFGYYSPESKLETYEYPRPWFLTMLYCFCQLCSLWLKKCTTTTLIQAPKISLHATVLLAFE